MGIEAGVGKVVRQSSEFLEKFRTKNNWSEQPYFLWQTTCLLYMVAFLLGMAIPISTALQNITIGMATALVLLLAPLRQRLKNAIATPVSLAGVLFFCLLIIGCAWSNVPLQEKIDTAIKMRWLLCFPFLQAFFANEKISFSGLIGFGCGVSVSVLLSLGLAVTGGQFMMTAAGDWAVFRTHAYHNYFIALLVYGLLVYVTTQKLTSGVKLLIGLAISLSLFDTFVLVQGRSGNIVMLALIVLWGVQYLRWKQIVMAGILVTLSVPLMLPAIKHIPALHNSIARGLSDIDAYRQGQTETSVGLRLEFYENSLRLIESKPWVGHGTGAFTQAYREFTGFVTGERASSNPHNDYLKFTVELGVLGLSAIVLLIVAVVWQAQAVAPLSRQLARGLIFSMALASIANSFFTDNITSAAFVVLLSMLFARVDTFSKARI